MNMKLGAETYRSFGDCCFHTPLLKALSNRYRTPIDVATHPSCIDAFINLPFIKSITPIDNLEEGMKIFKKEKYDVSMQLTSFKYFPNKTSSLLDVQKAIADSLKLPLLNRRPIFIPTKAEIDIVGNQHFDVALESEYLSQQSWATQTDFDMILKTFDKQRILWCSKPEGPDNTYRFDTRRETIVALKNVKHFFCVGSGLFCASLNGLSPENTYVLWIDKYYKYKKPMRDLMWDTNITWIEDRDQLVSVLNKLRKELSV